MRIVERIRLGDRGKGSLLRYEDSANWTFSYYQGGKEHRVSTKTADEKVARRFAKQRLAEVSADRQGLKKLITPLAARVTVDQLLDAYFEDLKLREVKSLYKIQSHMKMVKQHFGLLRASAVTAETIDRYVTARRAEGRANGTINKYLAILSAALKLGVQRKRLTEMPAIRMLSVAGNARQGFFEAAEFELVVNALPAHLKDLAKFAYVTGWRQGEIVGLRWDMVDLAAQTVRLPTTKNGRPRVLHLAGEVLEIIKRQEQRRLIERRGDVRVVDRVFHRPDGRSLNDFKKAWHSALTRAGLSHTETVYGKVVRIYDKCFHDLRRTAIRNLVRSGVRETVAMAISGHKTRSVFDRYNISSGADVREAMERVSAPPSP